VATKKQRGAIVSLCVAVAIAIVSYLLPQKTPALTVFLLIVLGLCFIIPILCLPWLSKADGFIKKLVRFAVALAVVVAAVWVFGFLVWPEPQGLRQAKVPNTAVSFEPKSEPPAQKPIPPQSRPINVRPAPPAPPSYVFLAPGVWVGTKPGYPATGGWDFIVSHRGPQTSFNVEILFVDEVKMKMVLQPAKTSLSTDELNSYQSLLRYPEIDAYGRGEIFAKQFIWEPPNPDHEHFRVDITWRDGTIHEELFIERVTGKFYYSMNVKDRNTGAMLFDCKDDGFPFGAPKKERCFPSVARADL